MYAQLSRATVSPQTKQIIHPSTYKEVISHPKDKDYF